jgi:hypothetical protein
MDRKIKLDTGIIGKRVPVEYIDAGCYCNMRFPLDWVFIVNNQKVSGNGVDLDLYCERRGFTVTVGNTKEQYLTLSGMINENEKWEEDGGNPNIPANVLNDQDNKTATPSDKSLEAFMAWHVDLKIVTVGEMLELLKCHYDDKPHILKHLELIEESRQKVVSALKLTHEKLNELYELELRLIKDDY